MDKVNIKNTSPFLMGLLFTVISIISAFSIVIPIISLIPLKWIFPLCDVISNFFHINVDYCIIITFSLLLIFLALITLGLIRKNEANFFHKRYIIVFSMVSSFFIVHPLIFTLYHTVRMGSDTVGQ